MNILERIISVIAPATCVRCGQEGQSLCKGCLAQLKRASPPKCVYCQALSENWRTCSKCRRNSRIYAGQTAGGYNPTVKALIMNFKLEHQRAAAASISSAIIQNSAKFIASLPEGFILSPVPTSSRHIRLRSFDHAKLLAKHLSDALDVPFVPALRRLGHSRQVGARRPQRLKQLKDTFYVADQHIQRVNKKTVVLVDDVMTTGATLEESARALKTAGARRVYALVLAKK